MELKDGKVNLTLAHTNGGVQYALLADDGTGKPDTTGPAVTGIAPGGTAWSYGTGVDLVFAGLEPNTDYYLVARPRGYTEVTYADAAYDEYGKLAAQKITTIAAEATDVLAGDITRAPGGTTITIAASGTKAGYTYAAVDPATGAITQTQNYTGADIKFEGLGSGAAYQIVASPMAGSYLPGVRVYPYPAAMLDKDYADSAVGAGSGGADNVPAGVEYTMKASSGTYLIGGENEWAVFSGSERLDLTEQGVVPAGKLGDGSPAMSVFDALDYLNITSRTAATVAYRAAVETGYSGPSVRPASEVVVPARPAAPAGSDYAIDYAVEKLTSNATLEWAASGSENWAEFTSGTEKTFAALGWDGAASRVVQLRKKAVTGTPQDEFPSKAFPVTILQRPSAPGGLLAELVSSDHPDEGITISGLADDGAYQYQAGVSGEWTTLEGIASGSVTLGYGTDTPEYNIRYSATQASPASFYATVSVLLNAGSVHFGTATYGDDITGQPVTIHNMSSSAITLEQDAVELSGADAEKFTLNTPGEQTVAAKGDNSAWTITPISGIGAKTYHVTVTISYTAGGEPHETSANVYLTVDKANWNMGNIKGNVSGVTENSFTINVTEGAPDGSKLSFSEASGRWTDVDAGVTSHTFTGLNPQGIYRAYVRAQADGNHIQSEAKVIAQTVYTAFETPSIGSVLHIDYTNETLWFTGGSDPANYTLTANGGEIENYGSLTALANEGITLSLVRKTDGTYPASAADTATITGKATAPVVTTKNASDDIKSDGTIDYAGSFQYRVSTNGANVTAGWGATQTGSANVMAGRYEVRIPPTAGTFASKITQVIVGSNNPTVTVHTKTAAGAESVLPDNIWMPSGWNRMSDGANRQGEYDHAYSGSQLALPAVNAVTSTSHVLKGWYDATKYNADTGEFTGDPVTVAPDNALDYYAKWAVRPVITGVATDTDSGGEPKAEGSLGEPANARGGLTADNPVRLDVRLAAGENMLEVDDIKLSGQSEAAEAKLYKSVTGSGESAEFAEEITGKTEISWGETPTKLYLKTVSADDDATAVYYELSVYATRIVSFTAEQTGGTKGANDDPDVRTSTGIDITFDEVVTGLVEAAAGSGGSGGSGGAGDSDLSNITITDSANPVVKGELKAKDGGEGKVYSLDITGVEESGDVSLSIADWAGYKVENTNLGTDEDATTRKVEVYRDGTAPTGTISIKDNNFTSFFNWVSFGLFFKETVDVTITPVDAGGDGVEKTEYLVSQESYAAPDALIAAITGGSLAWQSGSIGDAVASLSIQPGQKKAVYAKITDRAGNISVLNSDGMVVYTDSAADTTEISYTKLSGADQTANVTLNGNTIKSISDGTDTLTAGSDYALSNNDSDPETITFKASYLEGLDANNPDEHYTLTISYNPLDEAYTENMDVDVDKNEKPTDTTIELNVIKAGSGVITLTMDQLTGVAYGTPITLTATVPKSGTQTPGGSVSFYRTAGTGDLLSTATISGTDAGGNGTASITLSGTTALDAGEYAAIHAEYAGDTNYAAGSGALATFTVSQAEQTSLVIKDTDGTFVTAGEAITGSKEITRAKDLTISITADGGESDGSYTWESDNTNAASIAPLNETNATITIGEAAENVTITLTKAENNNYEAKSVSFTLNVKQETTVPTPGAGVAALPTDITQTTAKITWTAATDNMTDAAKLKYYVYRSATQNIGNLADCEANGAVQNAGGTENITEFSATGLTPGAVYWYNVVVEDEAENKAAYTQTRVAARLDVTYTAKQIGGKNGRETTTGILVTFSGEVRELHMDHITISDEDGLNAQPNGAVIENGDEDRTTWLIPVRFDKDADVNGKTIQIMIADWTTENGRGYNLEDGTGAGKRTQSPTVYGEVKWPTPEAKVDFVNERLTGLAAEGTYRFKNDAANTEYGGEVKPDSAGNYYHIPFDTLDTNLNILRVGVPTDTSLTDDELGHTDSLEQTLEILGRPAAPELTLSQPEIQGGTGSFTITDYDSLGHSYEYITQAGFNAIPSTTLYTESAGWVPVTAAETSGLIPGAYYVRVKAVAAGDPTPAGSFASDKTSFYIHAFDELDFEGLEGYSSADVPAKAIVSDDPTHTITGATIKNSDANDKFTISGNAPDFTVQPVGLLTRGEYTATVVVSYNGGVGDSETKLTFIVHPTAEWAETNSIVASSTAGPGGLTDTLTLKFKYPIALAYGDVVLSGAAEKSGADFTNKNDDQTEYVLAVKPKNENKTGDNIGVTVNLGSQFTDQGIASLGGTANVTIPRAIEETHAIPPVPGFATGSIQFTLNHDLAPVLPAGTLMWGLESSPYAGPVVLGGEADAEITAVYYVTGANDSELGYTFRVFVTVTDGGAATVGIPSWGIEPFAVEGGLVTGKVLGDVAYFLNTTGYNYRTDMAGYQVLQELDAAPGYPYAAPELVLYTNKEYSESVTAEARVYGPDDTTGRTLADTDYTLTDGGSAQFHFSDGNGTPENITKQLLLTLKRDWTRENGAHRIAVVFNDGNDDDEDGFLKNTLAQATVPVGEIIETYPLTMISGTGAKVDTDGDSTAQSPYGIPASEPVTGGAFAQNASVTITAGTADADAGYKFGSWTQTVGPATAITLPGFAEGQITMPAEPVTLTANYIDGKAPVTEIGRADGAWIGTADKITLTATDYDVTKGGANAGTVDKIYYKIDGANEPTQYNDVGNGPFTLVAGTHTVAFWSVDAAGNIEPEKTVTMHVDNTAPTASVTIRGETYDDFTSASAGYTRFYKGDKPTLTIAADDPDGLDVEKIEYVIGENDAISFEDEDDAAEDKTADRWTTWTKGSAAPQITGYGTYRVYVRVTDTVGNITVVKSDGIVYYEDSTPETATASFIRLGTGDADVTLALNDNTIASVVNTKGTPEVGDDVALESVTDNSDNPDYTVSGTTLTLKNDYLKTLDASDTAYTLQVNYAPRGESYVSTINTNNAPATTTITLTVSLADSTVTLSAGKASGMAAYGEAITLTATVKNGDDPVTSTDGTVEFYDGTTKLGEAAVDTDGTATFTSGALGNGTPLTAGTHAFKAVYKGDDNYAESKDETTLAAYEIEKANQDTLTITSAVTINDGQITATYGDPDITLTANGGSGDGGYRWTSGGSTAAVTGAGQSATVSLLAVTNSVNIYAEKAESANYKASNLAVVNLVIKKKEVEIKYTPNASNPDTKIYDGTDAITLNGTWSLEGLKSGDDGSVSIKHGTGSLADNADVGENKPVTCVGFELEGDKTDFYTLKEQPTDITATVTQQTPTWGAQPTASAIIYGQKVEDSTLSGGWTVNGVSGGQVTGTVDWAAGVKTGVPGSDDTEGLNESGYSYTVTFTPSGDDAKNYTTLDGSANIIVGKATPRMAGSSDAKPHGSTIFANPPSSDTLADSEITGDTVFDYGGVATSMGGGAWSWAVDTTEAFLTNELYERSATFTPTDPRINPFTIDAEFAVYSPKTEIETDPAVSDGVYGMKLKDISFTGNGKVVATSVDPGESQEDITTEGFWAWKNPDATLTSLTGTQTATAVFTPNDLVDFENPPLSGYVTAETELTITVAPATPTLNASDVTAPVIDEGDALSVLGDGDIDAALKAAGYTFDGVFSSQTDLAGTFDWDEGADFDPSAVVPGQAGHETSRDGNGTSHSVKGEGVYYIRIKFTPDRSYGQAYEPVSFAVRIDVTLKVIPPPPVNPPDSDDEVALQEAVTGATEKILPALEIYGENYDPLVVAGFREAFEAAKAAVDSAGLTQERASELLTGLKTAQAGLVHHHPVIFNTASGGITGMGAGAEISIKGDYRTVTKLTLNGKDFMLGIANGDEPRAISFEGRSAGTISKGSLVIDLTPEFMDSLPNGDYEVLAHFTDSYLSGDGDAEFTINRAADNTRWAYEDGNWYLYDADDEKLTGWQYIGGSWYYLDKTDGIMQTGWLYDGGSWYYLRGNGKMAVNAWVKDNGSWYYLRGNGKMAVNAWVKDNGSWYYLRGNGKMAAQSWAKDGGAWYYLKPSGIMAESVWLRDKNNMYYLKPGGKMAVSERLRIGGKYYRFDGAGVRMAVSVRGVAAR
jgi:hypothetical protein